VRPDVIDAEKLCPLQSGHHTMNEPNETEELVVLGDATALTLGEWMPGGMEGFVHPDFYDA
jgi:hypothetical protein